MRVSRSFVLITLALLTACFLGAAYTIWFNDLPTWLNAYVDLRVVNASDTPMTPAQSPSRTTQQSPTQAVHLTITEEGIATVSAGQLRATNLDFQDFSTAGLSLTHNGKPVPFYVTDEGDEAALHFFARAQEDSMAPPNVYVLEAGNGIAMRQRNAQPNAAGSKQAWKTQQWEGNAFFVADASSHDKWVGAKLIGANPWSTTLEPIVTAASAAQLTVTLFADTFDSVDEEPAYYVEILLNGRLLAGHGWQGSGAETVRFPIADNHLVAQQPNTITIVAPHNHDNDNQRIYVDAIRLEYLGDVKADNQPFHFRSDGFNLSVEAVDDAALFFDITDRSAPVLLKNVRHDRQGAHFASDGRNREYIVLPPEQGIKPTISTVPRWPSSLRDPARGADYLAIVASRPGFDQALEPLLEYRNYLGLTTTAVSLEQIYAEFDHGHHSPQAIRQFLEYAAAEWHPAPRYILLVGDATYDLHNHLVAKNRNLLPSPFVFNGERYVASDSWYTHFTESNGPVAMIGRFPAQNAGQLQAMVAKTLAYEQQPQAEWLKHALLVADDEPHFERTSGALTSQLTQHGYQVYALNMSRNTQIQHDILSAINQGVGLVNYEGSGNEVAWGDEAVLQSSDASQLRNGARLPILTTFHCSTGAFADPNLDALAENLLRVDHGGIVAAVAPSGLAAAEVQVPLAEKFYALLLAPQTETIGEALTALQQLGATDAQLAPQLSSLNLLGDPALKIRKP